jgi:polyhydroxybutyrate depolymerase
MLTIEAKAVRERHAGLAGLAARTRDGDGTPQKSPLAVRARRSFFTRFSDRATPLAGLEIFFMAVEALRRRATRVAPPRVRALAALALALTGCEPPVSTLALIEPETGRPYRLAVRGDHDASKPVAVLFALHAYATPPDVIVDAFSLVRHAVRDRKWLLVIPEGKLDGARQPHWNATAACCGDGARNNDDLGYLRAVLRDVQKRYTTDPERVFAFGVSNGAFMAQRWASTPGAELTGIIGISGAGPGPDDLPFAPPRPVSVVHVHGLLDDVIPYAGKEEAGRRQPSVPDSVEKWVEHDGCDAKSERTQRRSLFLSLIDVETWGCPEARVTAWTFQTGRHNIRDARFFTAEFLDLITPR